LGNHESHHELKCALGNIHYKPGDIITFPRGIYGFEDYERFVFVNHEEYLPFHWMVALENPDLMFTLIDPLLVCRDYNPHVNIDSVEEIWALVTIAESSKKVTVNLRAPIIITGKDRCGEQIISPDEKYPLKYEIQQTP